eukprot:UC1_evm2s1194
MSAELQWSVVRKNSRYLLRNRAGSRETIDTHPLNITGKNSFTHSGLSNDNAVGISADGTRGVVLTVKTKAAKRNPAKGTSSSKLIKGPRSAYKAIKAVTAGSYARGDLTQAALAKTSSIYKAQRLASKKKRKV